MVSWMQGGHRNKEVVVVRMIISDLDASALNIEVFRTYRDKIPFWENLQLTLLCRTELLLHWIGSDLQPLLLKGFYLPLILLAVFIL